MEYKTITVNVVTNEKTETIIPMTVEQIEKVNADNFLFEKNKYKAQRATEYPSFADQFDTIFHDGLDAWKAQIQAVKDKYPKGK
jgi:hypothetical protein